MTPKTPVRAGFSVVEVLAAVALMAIAILPLYQLQRALTDAAVRLELQTEALDTQQSALAILETINPHAEPEGSRSLGRWQMSWRSSQVAFTSEATGFLGQSNYELALYEIVVTLERQNFRTEFETRRIGWRLIRDPLADIGGTPG